MVSCNEIIMGFIFAFLAAVFVSASDIFKKRGLDHMNDKIVAWSTSTFAVPFLLLALFVFKSPVPAFLGKGFWIALFVNGILCALVWTLFVKAIKYSDLSVTAPMLAFTPVFLLVTSPLMLGEIPKLAGWFGVLLVFIGSYILKIKEVKNGYFAPIKSLFDEKGVRLMLLVAFIWSITSNVDKIGVKNSSPLFWSLSVNVVIAIILSLVALREFKKEKIAISKLLPIGFFNAMSHISQMTAVGMILVPYVISIKRLSIVITAIAGALIFKETGFRERLLGLVIMLAGVFLITLG